MQESRVVQECSLFLGKVQLATCHRYNLRLLYLLLEFSSQLRLIAFGSVRFLERKPKFPQTFKQDTLWIVDFNSLDCEKLRFKYQYMGSFGLILFGGNEGNN